MAQRNRSPWVMAGEYTTLAMVLPCATAVGYVIGHFLDRWLHTEFLKMVFLLVGIAAGFVELIRQVRKDTDDSGPPAAPPGGSGPP